jgi:hypothetical protein
MAYRLAGRDGYERIRVSDEKHIAPGADTIRELFGGQPTLILLDEISVYLRKVERAFPDASKQFAAFVHDLFKAVASTPQVALVYTLAVGKDDKAGDAYKDENERAAAAMSEAESVAVRSTTPLNPTEEDETPNVLRARLFEHVDLNAAQSSNRGIFAGLERQPRRSAGRCRRPGTPRPVRAQLPAPSQAARNADREDRFAQHVPTHARHAAIAGPHRSPPLAYPAAGRRFDPHAPHGPGLRADPHRDQRQARPRPVRAGGQIRCRRRGGPGTGAGAAHRRPEVSRPAAGNGLRVACTIFWHTLAYGDPAKGITPEQLKLSVCSPALEPSFIEQARVQFVTDSIYLDDRPGAPLRFMAEPNLTMIIRRIMRDIDAAEVRTELAERIRALFNLPRGEFNAVLSPAGPYEVPDEVGDGRPLLVVMNHESTAVPSDLREPPPDIAEIFEYKGAERKIRELKNNLVFVAADERAIPNMRDLVRRRLALGLLQKPPEHHIDTRRLPAGQDQSRIREAEAGRGHGHSAVLPPSVLPVRVRA